MSKAVLKRVREFEKIAIVASSGEYAALHQTGILSHASSCRKSGPWSELEGEKEFALTELPFGFRGETSSKPEEGDFSWK